MSAIERRITTEYPTRYSAFKNPRVLFEQKNTELTSRHAGAEFAVYHEPVENTAYPNIKDGLYASVCSFQGRYYLAEIHATQPWKGRKQSGDSKHFDKYADAVGWLLEQIPKFQQFIQSQQPVCDICGLLENEHKWNNGQMGKAGYCLFVPKGVV